MYSYRLFVVNDFDDVLSFHSIACLDDGEASAIARSLVSETCGVEVWDVSRRVLKLACDGPSAVNYQHAEHIAFAPMRS